MLMTVRSGKMCDFPCWAFARNGPLAMALAYGGLNLAGDGRLSGPIHNGCTPAVPDVDDHSAFDLAAPGPIGADLLLRVLAGSLRFVRRLTTLVS